MTTARSEPDPGLATVRIGYMPLTDCASVLMAAELGFDRRHGIRIVPVRMNSWAAVRDRLLGGGIELAHVLYGLVYGVHLGIGGPRQAMAALMTLDQNGQGITLSRTLAERGAVDAESLARLMQREPRSYTFAQTFPTGTHALWLYHWLAAAGVHPLHDARSVTVAPPQMVAHMRRAQVDGFSVGEPWNQLAVNAGVGVTVARSQDIWPNHPEKVLGGTAAWVDAHPDAARAAIAAVLAAGRWIDSSDGNRRRAAEALSRPQHLGLPVDTILPRLLGHYDDGLGRRWTDAHPVRFFGDGEVNFPYLSDGMWFMTQYRRWGLVAEHPDYERIARQVNRTALYAEAAGALGVALPASPMRTSRLVDGAVWDGTAPAAYADAFAVRTPPIAAAA